MTTPVPVLRLHPDRLLPPEPGVRSIARRLYAAVRDLPILSAHSHVDPRLLVDNEPFADPASLFVTPDHYVTRLLHASGGPAGRPRAGPRPTPGGRCTSGVAAALCALGCVPRHA